MNERRFKTKVVSLPRVNEISEAEKKLYISQCSKNIKHEYLGMCDYYDPSTLKKIREFAKTLKNHNLVKLYNYRYIKECIKFGKRQSSNECAELPLLKYNNNYYKLLRGELSV